MTSDKEGRTDTKEEGESALRLCVPRSAPLSDGRDLQLTIWHAEIRYG